MPSKSSTHQTSVRRSIKLTLYNQAHPRRGPTYISIRIRTALQDPIAVVTGAHVLPRPPRGQLDRIAYDMDRRAPRIARPIGGRHSLPPYRTHAASTARADLSRKSWRDGRAEREGARYSSRWRGFVGRSRGRVEGR